MPLLVTSVPNLAQGVSQQPDNLRYPGQCDEQINAWSTVVEGLTKRPNTRWVNQFNSEIQATPVNLFTHFVKRDEDNKYCVQVSLGGGTPTVGVIDLEDGTNVPVATTSTAQSYLSGITNPLADLRALTVADYTFLVNKKKEVKVDTDPALLSKDIRDDNGKYNALVFVKLGDYEKTYDIYLEGKVVPHGGTSTQSNKTPPGGHTYESGSSNSSGTHADTEIIAEDLETVLNAYLGGDKIVAGLSMSGGSGFSPSSSGTTSISYSFSIEQFEDDGTGNPDLTQKVGYGAGGTLIMGPSGAVQSFELTHKGTGYDSTQTTPGVYDKPFVLTITQNKAVTKRIHRGPRKPASYTTETSKTVYTSFPSTPGVVMPTFTPSLPSSAGYTVERQGAVIKIQADHDFSLRTEDGLANEGLGVAYKEVASITDLPKRCFNDFRMRIRGDADIDQDDYYVIFSTKDRENFGEGTWVETVGWDDGPEAKRASKGIDTTIDNSTMPIALVADSYDSVTGKVNSFTLQTPNEYGNVVVNGGVFYNLVEDHISNSDNEPGTGTDWQDYWVTTTAVSSAQPWKTNVQYFEKTVGYGQRNAGDNATNPFPSFVGKTINDVFFFKNRLGFLTDSNVIFSEADEYFNFFRTTTQQLLDSAPIDVGLSHTKVAVLQHALPFQEKLMLFSDNSQFVLRGADILSPKTVAISPVTEYDISDGIAPLALGPYIYFPFNRGQYEGMLEYFVDNNTEVFEAEEITSQVPKYIPTSIKRMAGSASESMVLLQSSTDLTTLYVYKYFWSGKEKIQSAWQKWTFSDSITGFDFIDSTLYLILEGKQLVEMPVENALTDTGLDYTLLLDNRVDGGLTTVSYNNQTNRTTISGLPDGYGATVDNTTIFTKGGSERKLVGSSSGTSVEIEGFIASYVKHDNVIYKCKSTHEASESSEPGTSQGARLWDVSTEVNNAPLWSTGDGLYNDENYFFIGRPYDMLYRFSNQALKQPTERGGRSASDYTYQTIRNGSIEYADTGHFTVEVTPRFRDKYTYVYNPALLSSISTLDRFTPESGHFRFGVQCRPEEATIEVKSSSALPVKLLAAEFESMVASRSRRYGA